VPFIVRDWAERELGGPVTGARTLAGGMSPGCAVRLRTTSGQAAFLKAVGTELNPVTPQLFRDEISVLRRLPRAPYRPALLATFDEGGWVALLMEYVEGSHPDLTDTSDAAAAWRAVRAQARELTPGPPGLPVITMAQMAVRWAERWRIIAADPGHYLPGWAAADVTSLLRRVESLPAKVTGPSLCHWDLRNDNMLIRPSGQAVIFDWGMARSNGPAWADEFFLALEWAGTDRIDGYLAEIGTHHGTPAALMTDLMLAIAGSQAWRSREPAPPGLPNLATFCADQARRLLQTVRRRQPGVSAQVPPGQAGAAR
jgi:serine/threonine protein kinase